MGRLRTALTALAIIVAAVGVYIYRSPQQERTREIIARMARNLGRLVGKPDRNRKPFEAIVREIETGDPAQRAQAIVLSPNELEQADVARMWPHLIRAMKDESEMVRNAAAQVAGYLSRFDTAEASAAEEGLAGLLGDPSPMVRATAAKSLGSVARTGQLDAPPPRLVACLDDDAEPVRRSAAETLVEYRRGPELIVPAALRRIPTETPSVRAAFTDLFWHVRLEPSVLPLLIKGLSSEDPEVRLSCTAAINHMGREASPALPDILALIRKELDQLHPADAAVRHYRIVAMAAGAIGELSPDAPPPPGAVDLLREVLRRAIEAGRWSNPDRPGAPVPPQRAPNSEEESLIAEAVWSLGIFGRSAATSASLLLSIFESIPQASDHLRGLIAESLAATGRGAPDEDRALASLANAWKTASPKQKSAIALALRSLGPKSERLVPELARQPPDGARPMLRPVRYPRSRRDAPVRE
jgi:HEAT repeat protein